jgi:circadian clock protein KaiB
MKTTKSELKSVAELQIDKGWLLRLYVTMQSPKSITAYSYYKEICELERSGKYQVEFINLLRNPQLDIDHQILPTMRIVNKLPEQFIKIIEDLYTSEHVLVGMDLIYSN